MKKRITIWFVGISTVFFVFFVGLYIYARIFDPNLYFPYSEPRHPHFFIPFGDATMAVEQGDGRQDVDAVFFNGSEPNSTTMVGNDVTVEGWDNTLGTSYCLFYNVASNEKWWTLRISLWYPIVILGITPLIVAARKIRSFCRKGIPLQDKILISLTLLSAILFAFLVCFFFYGWFLNPGLLGVWYPVVSVFNILSAMFVIKKLRTKMALRKGVIPQH